MSCLHLVSLAEGHSDYQQLAQLLGNHDAIVLLADALFADTPCLTYNVPLYVWANPCDTSQIPAFSDATMISANQLANLIGDYDKSLSWHS